MISQRQLYLFPKIVFIKPKNAPHIAALVIIVLIAAFLRLYDVNWDNNKHLHPDERAIVQATSGIALPSSWEEFIDPSRSSLNPQFFAYGSLPFYLVKASGSVLAILTQTPWWISYDGITLWGRIVSALFDVGTVLIIYALALLVFRRKSVGILSSALAAFTVFHIQMAHFYVVDGILTFFTTLTLYSLLHLFLKPSLSWILLTGCFWGFALACKISAISLILPVIATAILTIPSVKNQLQKKGYEENSDTAVHHPINNSIENSKTTATIETKMHNGFSLPFTIIGIPLVALFFMFLAMPYAFIDKSSQNYDKTRISIGPIKLSSAFSSRIIDEINMSNGQADLPYTRQYAFTTPYWYHIKNLVLWGMGVPLGLTSLIAVIMLTLQTILKKNPLHIILLSWMIPYFIYIGGTQVKFMRYLLPLYPLLILLASWLLITITIKTHRIFTIRNIRISWGTLTSVIVVLTTALYALAFLGVYIKDNSRLAASAWMYDNIPPRSTISVEEWDDSLPYSLSARQDNGVSRFNLIRFKGYEDDGITKLEHCLSVLEQADYITMSSNRLWASIPRLPKRYPLTTKMYQLLFEEKLGFSLVYKGTNYPSILGFDLVDDTADESFTVYDHPMVLIYKKNESFSLEKARELLENFDNPIIKKPIDFQKNSLILDNQSLKANQALDTRELFVLEDADMKSIHIGFITVPYATVRWYFFLIIISLLFFIPSFFIFQNFIDRGYAFAKITGIVITTWIVWWLAHLRLVEYTPFVVKISVILFGSIITIATVVVVKYICKKDIFPLIRIFLKKHWRLILFEEFLFLVALSSFLFIRMLNPDIWEPWLGGEKLFEHAFLAGITKSAYFPPYDPWFSGESINYYYYGLYIISFLAKATTLPLRIVFTLAVPTIVALTVSQVFSIIMTLLNTEKRR